MTSFFSGSSLQLTTNGHLLNSGHQRWDTNEDVRSYAKPLSTTQDADTGDVIVDPQGVAYRVEGKGFNEIKAASQPNPSPGDIAEDRGGPDSPGPEPSHKPGRGR